MTNGKKKKKIKIKALILHEEAIEKFEEENEENEENIPEDQDFPKIPPTEEELKFLQTGIDSYQKVFFFSQLFFFLKLISQKNAGI